MIPDPDEVRIRESYQTKGECLRIWIFESGFGTFFMRTPDSHLIRTVRYGSTPPVPIRPFSCVCKGNRHLDHIYGTGYAMPVAGPNVNQVRQNPLIL